jgi:hypothetical protein
MQRSKSRSPAQERAIQSHRDALAAAKKAVDDWAAKGDDERFEVIASAIIERLDECATDTDGDPTLEVVSDFFEDHWQEVSDHLSHILGELAKAAHALGKLNVHGY